VKQIIRFFIGICLEKFVYLTLYVDDIIITGNDVTKISHLKKHLCSHLQSKDLGWLKYSCIIDVTQSNEGILNPQRKYALGILQETRFIVDTWIVQWIQTKK